MGERWLVGRASLRRRRWRRGQPEAYERARLVAVDVHLVSQCPDELQAATTQPGIGGRGPPHALVGDSDAYCAVRFRVEVDLHASWLLGAAVSVFRSVARGLADRQLQVGGLGLIQSGSGAPFAHLLPDDSELIRPCRQVDAQWLRQDAQRDDCDVVARAGAVPEFVEHPIQQRRQWQSAARFGYGGEPA